MGLEVMLFAKKVLVKGVWIPTPKPVGNDLCPLTHPAPASTRNPSGIPAGAIRGPGTYRWAQMANLRSHRPLSGCSHLRLAPFGEPLSEPGKDPEGM